MSLSGTENCTQPSGVASTSRNQVVSELLHVEPLPSNLWLFDNAAFCSAFSAEQISQDLSAPLEIELFDPSQLFADFNPVVAADGEMNNIVLLFTSLMRLTGVQDHAASHPDPLFHSASIANYGESSSHVKQSCEYLQYKFQCITYTISKLHLQLRRNLRIPNLIYSTLQTLLPYPHKTLIGFSVSLMKRRLTMLMLMIRMHLVYHSILDLQPHVNFPYT